MGRDNDCPYGSPCRSAAARYRDVLPKAVDACGPQNERRKKRLMHRIYLRKKTVKLNSFPYVYLLSNPSLVRLSCTRSY
jgi:hypothetical protein